LSAPNVVVVVVVVVDTPNEKSGLSDTTVDPNVVVVVIVDVPNEKSGLSETTAALGDSVALFFLFTLEASSGLSSPSALGAAKDGTENVDPSLEALEKLGLNVEVDEPVNDDGVVNDEVVKDGEVKDGVVNVEVVKDGLVNDGVVKVEVVGDGVVNDGVVKVEANGASGALITFGSLKVLAASRFFLGKGTVSKSASSSSSS